MASFAIGAKFCFQLHEIYASRSNPPTRGTVLDGRLKQRGVSRWGRLCNILLLAEGFATNITEVKFGDAWDVDADKWKEAFTSPVGDPAVSVNYSLMDYHPPEGTHNGQMSGKLLVLNLSSLVPNFGDDDQEFGVTTRVPVYLGFEGRGQFDFYVAPPEMTLHEVMSAEIGGAWGCDRPIHFQGQFMISGGIYSFSIRKFMLPTRGVHWGWPWEGPQTRPKYRISQMSAQHFDPEEDRGKLWLWLYVGSSTVALVEPIGIVPRVLRALLQIGSTIPLLSAAFYLVFVRKYERTPLEDKHSALTLVGGDDLVPSESEESKKESDTGEGLSD
uniref:Uncharacterized protein n=1 Tax=Alexandrium catenella TaxID=2925 RepID=A0A7S1RN91_ALECA